MAPGLFGFGVSLAMERENGLLTLKRAMPMPPYAYLVGKMVMAMVVAAGVLTLLVLLAVFVAHVPVTGAQIARAVSVERAGRAAVLRAGPAARHAGEGPGRAGGDQHAVPADGVPVGPVVPGARACRKAMQSIAPALPSFHLNALALDAVDIARGQSVAAHRDPGGVHRRRVCGSPRGACASVG